MNTISASQVKSLRDKTGISMGDCKKALVEAGGDEDKAIDVLKEKYAGQMELRADKEAANGRIGAFADGRAGALVELRCETDFVANNEAFKTTANRIAEIAARTGIINVEQLLQARDEGGQSPQELIAEAYATLKEKMSLARAARIENGVACYVHHNGLVGTVLAADAPGDDTARHICMHIAAQRTLDGLHREHVAPDEVERAQAHMRQEAAGKPDNIIEKIVSGKMNRWFSERVLLEQPFAMDDKKTVQQVAQEAGINIQGYLKFELGVKSE